MKGYFTAKELAAEWKLTARRVCSMCKNGQLEGAEKVGHEWLIPQNVEKPVDKRLTTGAYVGWRKSSAKE